MIETTLNLSQLASVTDMNALSNPSSIQNAQTKTRIVGAARSLVSSVRNVDGSVREDFINKAIKPEDGKRDDFGPARVSPWWSMSFNLMAGEQGLVIQRLAHLSTNYLPFHCPQKSWARGFCLCPQQSQA